MQLLKSNHEVVGVLSDIKVEKGNVKAVFSMQKELELSADKISEEEVREFLGKRIGLLHLEGGDYRVRKIKRK